MDAIEEATWAKKKHPSLQCMESCMPDIWKRTLYQMDYVAFRQFTVSLSLYSFLLVVGGGGGGSNRSNIIIISSISLLLLVEEEEEETVVVETVG